MSRVFAYCRVSTTDQTHENQILEIQSAGFHLEPRRVIAETVSGSTAAMEREGFRRLVDRLESGDVLVVTKLDRLGRNAMDVRATVEQLAELSVRVHCLALGGVDLTSPAGKMTMAVIAAVAEFERDLLIERTQAGLSRAKAQGKKLGRPASLTPEQMETVRKRRQEGTSLGVLSKEFGVSRSAIQRATMAIAM
ncbi:recombinase family protein [Novosphingobium sp. CECT 9465]|uniref:recombinase family protein n=1 Tax=Novosphingobium sp. CECT 9465 TaxID=2829794 RepID=UPI001E2A21C1|nr:recombinase family protein [Novosphingobium sp. CECT 9465]CAH0497216.1 Tn3 family transposase ISYps3 [Novosphingobium sp. CECT 9465]